MSHAHANDGVKEPGIKVTKRPPKRTSPRSKVPTLVNRTMTVEAIVGSYPQTTETLALYGLHCFGCAASGMESLEEGCRGHGFTDEEINALVADLNETIALAPPRPMSLIVTTAAADKIAEIAAAENRGNPGLVVEADEHGGFYLEFRDKPERGDHVFTPHGRDDVRVFASTLTLQRIGGSTIDVRDGRFKLDLEGAKGCVCGDGGCGCK